MTWPHRPLADLLDLSIGGVWGKAPGDDEVDVLVARVTELRQGGRLELSTAAHRSITERQLATRRLRPGDLLLEKSGGGPKTPVGRVGLVTGTTVPTVCANFMQLLRPNTQLVEPRFLHLYLHFFHLAGRTEAMQTASTNIRNIKASEYVQLDVPAPTLVEQRRIVELLEDHLSRLDAADGDLQRARFKSDAMVLAALRAHVESIRSSGVSFGTIGDLAATNLGKMLDAKKTAGEPTPYLANINVRWGRFDLENLKSVPLTTEERGRLTILAGDLMVCEGGEPGRCAVWDRDDSGIAYQKALHRVRVHDRRRMEPEYLSLMLRETIQSGRADRLFTGTTIKHLPQEKLRLIEVPVPEHSVQVAALSDLARVAGSSERLTGALQTAETQNKALRSAVLAAAFSGKLTGRHTDDEVIEELAGAMA